MRRKTIVTLAALVGLCMASSAHANPLLPGGNSTTYDAFTLGGAGANDPLTLVTTLSGNLAAPSIGLQKFFGTYTEWVYENNSGTLDFIYQINLNSKTTSAITRITATAFGGVTTDVGVLTSGSPPGSNSGGLNPNNGGASVIDRSSNVVDGGATIGWNFGSSSGTNITKNTSSAILVVATNATTFQGGGILSGIDGSTTSNNALQPGPEPSTTILAGLGALGLISYGLRRRKAVGA
jgi:hypothetical protein